MVRWRKQREWVSGVLVAAVFLALSASFIIIIDSAQASHTRIPPTNDFGLLGEGLLPNRGIQYGVSRNGSSNSLGAELPTATHEFWIKVNNVYDPPESVTIDLIGIRMNTGGSRRGHDTRRDYGSLQTTTVSVVCPLAQPESTADISLCSENLLTKFESMNEDPVSEESIAPDSSSLDGIIVIPKHFFLWEPDSLGRLRVKTSPRGYAPVRVAVTIGGDGSISDTNNSYRLGWLALQALPVFLATPANSSSPTGFSGSNWNSTWAPNPNNDVPHPLFQSWSIVEYFSAPCDNSGNPTNVKNRLFVFFDTDPEVGGTVGASTGENSKPSFTLKRTRLSGDILEDTDYGDLALLEEWQDLTVGNTDPMLSLTKTYFKPGKVDSVTRAKIRPLVDEGFGDSIFANNDLMVLEADIEAGWVYRVARDNIFYNDDTAFWSNGDVSSSNLLTCPPLESFAYKLSSDECRITGWIEHPNIDRYDGQPKQLELRLVPSAGHHVTVTGIKADQFVDGYSNRLKVDINYPTGWKSPQSDAGIIFTVQVGDIDETGVWQKWLVTRPTPPLRLKPWHECSGQAVDYGTTSTEVAYNECRIQIWMQDPRSSYDLSRGRFNVKNNADNREVYNIYSPEWGDTDNLAGQDGDTFYFDLDYPDSLKTPGDAPIDLAITGVFANGDSEKAPYPRNPGEVYQLKPWDECIEDEYAIDYGTNECRIQIWIRDSEGSPDFPPRFNVKNSDDASEVYGTEWLGWPLVERQEGNTFYYDLDYPDSLKIPGDVPIDLTITGVSHDGHTQFLAPHPRNPGEVYQLKSWDECSFGYELSSDGCRITGWIRHPNISRADGHAKQASLRLVPSAGHSVTVTGLVANQFVDGYLNRLNVDIDYPPVWKSPQSDHPIIFMVQVRDFDENGVQQGWLVTSPLLRLNPYDSLVDELGDDDYGPIGRQDCHIGVACPPGDCEPTRCDVSPMRVKASKGVSLLGDDFPLFAEFYHDVEADSRRLFHFEFEVTGPSGFSDSYDNIQPEKSTKTVFNTRVYNPPSAGKHQYTWTVNWRYDITRENLRQTRWDNWRVEHQEWVRDHQSWVSNGGPSPSSPGYDHSTPHDTWSWTSPSGKYSASGATDTDHTHPRTCYDRIVTGPSTCTDTDYGRICSAPFDLVERPCPYSHSSYSGTRARYDAAQPREPSWPSDPNPEGVGGTLYNPGYGSYPPAPQNVFNQTFPPHSEPRKVVTCNSEQLVVVAPECRHVRGLEAYVGDSQSVTRVVYFNPNTHPDADFHAYDIGFTIQSENYHSAIRARGPPPNYTATLLANRATTIDGEDTIINLPGDYNRIIWDLKWTTDWGDFLGDWPSATNLIVAYPPPKVTCGIIDKSIQIFAKPPTCRLEFHQFEVDDSATTVKIHLTNPNGVPIALNAATYRITTIAPSPARVSSPAIAPKSAAASIHNPRTSYPPNDHYPDTEPQYIPARSTVTLVSQPHPYSVPQQYRYNWQIQAFLGIERWSTNNRSAYQSAHPVRTAEYVRTTDGGLCANTLRLAYLPYVKVYEGGVAAGGRFGTAIGYDACSAGDTIIGDRTTATAQGRVFGFRKDTNLVSAGASSEYALRAFGQIQGYYSASQRNRSGQVGAGLDQPHLGLSFSNTDNLPHGGNYGLSTTDSFANRRCLAHYWATIALDHTRAQTSPVLTNSLDLSDPLVTRDSQLYRDGDLTLSATDDEQQLSTAIFTKGDLFITSDIYNNRDAIWQGGDRTQVGSIYLITKGNVYIDKDVTRIDAIIIALPPDNQPLAQGTVYTCSEGTTRRYRFSNHHTACLNPLTVNGAVIARAIVLGRTNGSRNLAQAFEHPEPYLQDYPQPPATDKVAEIFYFSPEYYISLPAASFIESQVDPNQYYRTDSIISLPPLF